MNERCGHGLDESSMTLNKSKESFTFVPFCSQSGQSDSSLRLGLSTESDKIPSLNHSLPHLSSIHDHQ